MMKFAFLSLSLLLSPKSPRCINIECTANKSQESEYFMQKAANELAFPKLIRSEMCCVIPSLTLVGISRLLPGISKPRSVHSY